MYSPQARIERKKTHQLFIRNCLSLRLNIIFGDVIRQKKNHTNCVSAEQNEWENDRYICCYTKQESEKRDTDMLLLLPSPLSLRIINFQHISWNCEKKNWQFLHQIICLCVVDKFVFVADCAFTVERQGATINHSDTASCFIRDNLCVFCYITKDNKGMNSKNSQLTSISSFFSRHIWVRRRI